MKAILQHRSGTAEVLEFGVAARAGGLGLGCSPGVTARGPRGSPKRTGKQALLSSLSGGSRKGRDHVSGLTGRGVCGLIGSGCPFGAGGDREGGGHVSR